MSIEYYQQDLCKHILSEVNLAKSHMPHSCKSIWCTHSRERFEGSAIPKFELLFTLQIVLVEWL